MPSTARSRSPERRRPAGTLVAGEVPGRGLDVDTPRVDPQVRGDGRAHRVETRPDARSGTDDHDIHARGRQPGGSQPRDHLTEQRLARDAARRADIGGKQPPEVAQPGRSSSASATAWSTTSPSE